jgi:hypothetical protein
MKFQVSCSETISNAGTRHISRPVNEQEKRVLETIESPEMVLSGDYGEKLAVKFYRTTPLTSKYLVVAYKELSSTDGFVVTAYFARKVADWREVLWKR